MNIDIERMPYHFHISRAGVITCRLGHTVEPADLAEHLHMPANGNADRVVAA